MIDKSALMPGVSRREVWAWSAFDFANSGYTTVVLTAVFNAYFVSVVAADAPWATFLWTLIIAVSNAVGIFVMPVVGAIADASAQKKSAGFSGRRRSAFSALQDSPSADRERLFWRP